MTLDRLRDCAEAYGADRRRWPADVQPLYDRFARTAEGAAVLAEAERTDRFLDAWHTGAPDAALAQSIAGHVSGPPGRRRIGWQATAFAAAAIIGFVIGFAQARNDAGTDVVTQLLLGPASMRGIGL